VAREVQIGGTSARAKIRSPWAPALLPFVTLGIYVFCWYYFINREMRDLGRARGSDELGDSPGKSLLAVTLGALVIVPAVISMINTAKRIQAAQRLAGVTPLLSGWLALVMALLITPVLYAYEQSELNKVWEPPRMPEDEAAAPAGTQPIAPDATPPEEKPPPTTPSPENEPPA
jgi:Domain of unknown function (DUF4234)